MKKITPFLFVALIIAVVFAYSFSFSSKYGNTPSATVLNGAWKLEGSQHDEVAIFTDGYFMRTTYNKAGKKLLYTYGGPYQFQNGTLTFTNEFNTADKEQVGQSVSVPLDVKATSLSFDNGGTTETWRRLDNGSGPLAGTWRSGGRMQDGKVSFSPLAARKTFKILSGTRFQWTAMNTETREMLGTGGGSYTFQNGKYTENLEFFSRDSSRVGMSLTFDSKVESDNWHSAGLNSRGQQMSEIWGKVK